ncbi:MAG: efflux RND transporter periplasmic adaptor subunit [Proteobacteria bacterium]|nr:efflux RND transporter periplasmic adaptor subunit [Pseudomonadota bacterium]MBU1584222.1 efflux RND transporter periplasmic adaptor subunit [Pseudomonadota bacterium]MBU2455540.1 efflux RND transporter periplasmic adaptor subunit [Pseudomonadota bacterium]MBU2631874.1 efflux RND transporter periplasmic adaptor subunit [Pseudomonadota bacterium]
METQSETPQPLGRKLLRLIWKGTPFMVVLLATLLIILPLGKIILAKKTDLTEKQSKETGVAKPLTNVITMELIPAMIMEKLSLPGIAKPWVFLEIVSEIKGKVVDKKAVEGHHVKKGDILAIIDTSDYKNSYDAALASYEIAVSSEKRLAALVKKNFVTQSQLDDAVARVKTSKADLENAKLALSRCMIRSPMEGIIDRVHIENGTFLNAGDPVAQMLQIDQLKIEVGIPESDVDAVRKLKSFDMTVDALEGKTYTGEYHYLYKTTDSMARLYILEIKVDNADGMILPDMFARVQIIKKQDPQGLSVPMYSLVSFNKETGVYVEKDGVVRFRPVTTGFQDGWKTQVSEGLNPGEKIVVVGHRIIEDGEQVNVTKTIRDMEEITQ